MTKMGSPRIELGIFAVPNFWEKFDQNRLLICAGGANVSDRNPEGFRNIPVFVKLFSKKFVRATS